MRNAFSVGVCLCAAALAVAITFNDRVFSQQNAEGLSARAETASTATATATAIPVTDAPTGFGVESNGFAEEFCANQDNLSHSTSSPKIPDTDCSFDSAIEEFDGHEDNDEGIGPVYNARGCGECHGTPILGGSSQVVERRAGFFSFATGFIDHPGGSLIHDRALDASIQETVIASRANVVALRASQSILGDGFVEAIGNSTLSRIAQLQPSSMRGQIIQVPVFEAGNFPRNGRFGWKGQQASLVSFSADAYLNEMGITSPLQAAENTSNGVDVSAFDNVPLGHPADPDNDGVDVELFALFMRSTLAPPVDAVRAAQPTAIAGSALFDQLSCNVCHTRTIQTESPGTLINGGALVVSNALGNKVIHPFGDFLLHDIDTGDGIVQNGGASTRNKVRTAPLWGLRARGRLMHDGLSANIEDAIDRHGNQAAGARQAFRALSNLDRARLLAFLRSL